jgi:hypothetical protein
MLVPWCILWLTFLDLGTYQIKMIFKDDLSIMYEYVIINVSS